MAGFSPESTVYKVGIGGRAEKRGEKRQKNRKK